ncbi:hypothetical protein ACOMHN_006129 [Nucella lapillus]
MTMPQDNDIMPQDSDIMPQYNDMMPKDNDIMPQDKAIMPQYNDIMPQDNDIMPQYNDNWCDSIQTRTPHTQKNCAILLVSPSNSNVFYSCPELTTSLATFVQSPTEDLHRQKRIGSIYLSLP